MYNEKKILAVIPARGGSKGVIDKNIRELNGKPLIAWTIAEARKSKYIDRLVLSSDSERIIDVAKGFGCEAPFVRPAELSGDEVLGVEPFIHMVETLEEKYDYALLLQCTSPLRTVEDIDGAIEKCLSEQSNSLISVVEAKSSPYRMQNINEQGQLVAFVESDKTFLPRQKLPKVYEFNGAIYLISTETLLGARSLLNDQTLAYVMSEENSLDIDTITDFTVAEALIKSKEVVT